LLDPLVFVARRRLWTFGFARSPVDNFAAQICVAVFFSQP